MSVSSIKTVQILQNHTVTRIIDPIPVPQKAPTSQSSRIFYSLSKHSEVSRSTPTIDMAPDAKALTHP